jgi:membrane protein YqaA with SNARE-associated domain
MVMERLKQKRWLRMLLYITILVGVSLGLVSLLGYLVAYLQIEEQIEELGPIAYLVVFGVTLASNATILVPVPIHVSVMWAAALFWNPILIVLVASVAGTLGEISGYYAGYFGRRIINTEDMPGYERLAGWMKRYGPWGVFFITLQPILPLDIAGLLAGASKLPLLKFLLPSWAGRFIRFLVIVYLGEVLLALLPLPFM